MNIFKEMGIREGSDRLNEEVLYNVARVYSIVDKEISDLLAKYDLSPAKFNILMMVKHVGKENGIQQNELSKLLLVTTSNITRMIDKLEKSKYVDRIPRKGDRRVNLLKITKKGSDLLDRIWPEYETVVSNFVGKGLNNTEKYQINQLLEKVIEGARQ